jgi:hypothetical protein
MTSLRPVSTGAGADVLWVGRDRGCGGNDARDPACGGPACHGLPDIRPTGHGCTSRWLVPQSHRGWSVGSGAPTKSDDRTVSNTERWR